MRDTEIPESNIALNDQQLPSGELPSCNSKLLDLGVPGIQWKTVLSLPSTYLKITEPFPLNTLHFRLLGSVFLHTLFLSPQGSQTEQSC